MASTPGERDGRQGVKEDTPKHVKEGGGWGKKKTRMEAINFQKNCDCQGKKFPFTDTGW